MTSGLFQPFLPSSNSFRVPRGRFIASPLFGSIFQVIMVETPRVVTKSWKIRFCSGNGATVYQGGVSGGGLLDLLLNQPEGDNLVLVASVYQELAPDNQLYPWKQTRSNNPLVVASLGLQKPYLKQSRSARGSSGRQETGGLRGQEGHSSRSCTYELRRTRQNVECARACESQLISSSLQVCLLEICRETCSCVRG